MAMVDFASMFGVQPTAPKRNTLFDVSLDFTQPATAPSPAEILMGDPWEKMRADLQDIEATRQEEVKRARGKGFLERYPVVDTPEKEKRVRAELEQQGLSKEQIKNRIAKFKKKGGQIKTSAKLGLAAKILGNAAGGYLAAAQRRPFRQPPVMAQLEAERERRATPGIEAANQAAKTAAAVTQAQAQSEAANQLWQQKFQFRTEQNADKALREFGLDPANFTALEDKNTAIALAAKTQNDQLMEMRKSNLELNRLQELRLREDADSRQLSRKFKNAFQVGDTAPVTNEDLTQFYQLDPSAPDYSAMLLAARNNLGKSIAEEKLREQLLAETRAQNIVEGDLDIGRKTEQLENLKTAAIREANKGLTQALARANMMMGSDPTRVDDVKKMLHIILVNNLSDALGMAGTEELKRIYQMVADELQRDELGLSDKQMEDTMRFFKAAWSRMAAGLNAAAEESAQE